MIEVLDEIKRLIKIRGTAKMSGAGHNGDLETQAITAMLLMEAAYGDEDYVWCEHRTLVQGLKRVFGLSKTEVDQVLSLARSLRPPNMKLADATRHLIRHLEDSDRHAVVELLWRVIDADSVVHEWEQVFADHVAHALGLDEEAATSVRRRSLDD